MCVCVVYVSVCVCVCVCVCVMWRLPAPGGGVLIPEEFAYQGSLSLYPGPVDLLPWCVWKSLRSREPLRGEACGVSDPLIGRRLRRLSLRPLVSSDWRPPTRVRSWPEFHLPYLPGALRRLDGRVW